MIQYRFYTVIIRKKYIRWFPETSVAKEIKADVDPNMDSFLQMKNRIR